jgi:hypothetical protein
MKYQNYRFRDPASEHFKGEWAREPGGNFVRCGRQEDAGKLLEV